jgi:hypothetical protein
VIEEGIAGSARGCLLDVDAEVVEEASLPVSDWELEYEVLLMVKGRYGVERAGRRNGGRSLERESRRKDFMRARKKLLSLQCVCKQTITICRIEAIDIYIYMYVRSDFMLGEMAMLMWTWEF